GLSKVLEFAKPSLLSRIGLRYLDAVFPEKSETIEQYLVKELHGVDFGWTPIQSIQESVYQTCVEPLIPNGFMVSRIHKMNGQLGFPPDMIPNGLLPLPRFSNTEHRMHAIIDTDHYVEGNMSTDLQLIEKQILSLHSKVKEAFEGMVSDFARTKWH
ncbi:TIGR04255 family protein, partial [Salmonella enterica subsp. enterica serovar Braenderup]|nr:TIGR04255 family protein [Salmonella enterica subsp. enterica serovar Braenderup]